MRTRSDYAGIAVIILAFLVGGAWATALVIAALPITDPITESGANILSTIGGILAGAIAAYLGASIANASNQARADVENEVRALNVPTPAHDNDNGNAVDTQVSTPAALGPSPESYTRES